MANLMLRALLSMMLTALVSLLAPEAFALETDSGVGADGEISSLCFDGREVNLRMKPSCAQRMEFNEAGFAAVMISDWLELVVVDRNGSVRVRHVAHTGDFDEIGPGAGLLRFREATDDDRHGIGGRCGYIDGASLKVLVAARFDQCAAFKDGHAEACIECQRYCTEAECQSSVFVGGMSYLLDSAGMLAEQFEPASLLSICGPTGLASVRSEGAVTYLDCKPLGTGPFNLGR